MDVESEKKADGEEPSKPTKPAKGKREPLFLSCDWVENDGDACVLIGTMGGTVLVVSLTCNRVLRELKAHTGPVTTVTRHPSLPLCFFTHSKADGVKLWNFETDECLQSIEVEGSAISVSADGSSVAVSCGSSILAFDSVSSLDAASADNNNRVSSDGKTLVTLSAIALNRGDIASTYSIQIIYFCCGCYCQSSAEPSPFFFRHCIHSPSCLNAIVYCCLFGPLHSSPHSPRTPSLRNSPSICQGKPHPLRVRRQGRSLRH